MAKQPLVTKNAVNKIGEYSLVGPQTRPFAGYQARMDPTTLGPTFLAAGSKNVVMETSGRISSVSGYKLDGSGSTAADSGILSNFDFDTFNGTHINLRAGFLTSAGNDGKLQFRYDDGTTVSWVDLMTGLTNVRLSYTEWWDNTNLVKDVLWVDGTNNIFAWNGSQTTLASATATTVTTQSTSTWAELGFATTGSIVIGGVTATYTGGTATTTLTGVSHDFSTSAAGSLVFQAPVTTALSSMTSILATFAPTIIGNGRENQVYLGSSSSSNLYISKVNDYTNYAFTTPTRVAGEGDLIPLDGPPVAFMPLEVHNDVHAYDMYISEGQNTWSIIRSTLSSNLTDETLEHIRLKVAPLAASQSERLTTKMKNQIMFVDNANVAQYLGYTSFQNVPVIQDFSWPIIDDMNSYDFTDASAFWYRNYVYIAIPKEGLMRIYNMTDQTKEHFSAWNPVEDVQGQPWFWEAPVTYPVSGFYTVGGELYGHAYTSSESYKLFTGNNFNGQDIECVATFGFDDHGDRTQSKGSNELWIEGYIQQNTILTASVGSDLDAFQTQQTVTVNGSDTSIVAYGAGAHSLGKNPLGSQSIGGAQTATSTLPAWFHVAKTYAQISSYLEQISFTSRGVDLAWKLICFGTNAQPTVEGNNQITQ